jgi:hypothetical protein
MNALYSDSNLYFAMPSYLNLDDVQSLKSKIEDKASHIFQSLPGKPSLQINRHFKKNIEGNKEAVHIVRDQDVRDVSELKALERVRDLVSYINFQDTTFIFCFYPSALRMCTRNVRI